jgi:hypothetical protein
LPDLYKRAKKYKETGEIAEDEMGTEASFIDAINPPVEKDITIAEVVDKKGTYKDQKGTRYFLVKNSWGTGNALGGYFYVSEAYFKYKTISVMLHKDGIDKATTKKLGI